MIRNVKQSGKKMSNLLQELKVSSMEDIHDLFMEMIGTFLENGLEEVNLTKNLVIQNTITKTRLQTTAGTEQAPRKYDQATER